MTIAELEVRRASKPVLLKHLDVFLFPRFYGIPKSTYKSHALQTSRKGCVIGTDCQRIFSENQLPLLDVPGCNDVSEIYSNKMLTYNICF